MIMKQNTLLDETAVDEGVALFANAQEAWFWFIGAQEALSSGARISAGAGSKNRPCEPVDILTILDRLYRAKDLSWDHLLVLRHYGRRKMAPDARRVKERRAAKLWAEALDTLSEPLMKKNIIERSESKSEIWNDIPDLALLNQASQSSMDAIWQRS